MTSRTGSAPRAGGRRPSAESAVPLVADPNAAAVVSHREYLDLLQERNRLVKKLQDKEKTPLQREKEEKERGFNL